jgi:hypothetical protein
MEEILLWQRESENVWTRPGYGVFGGHKKRSNLRRGRSYPLQQRPCQPSIYLNRRSSDVGRLLRS